jgi:hypothetical protein
MTKKKTVKKEKPTAIDIYHDLRKQILDLEKFNRNIKSNSALASPSNIIINILMDGDTVKPDPNSNDYYKRLIQTNFELHPFNALGLIKFIDKLIEETKKG